MASTNNFAEPSRIGISTLSISIKALSIPIPYNAPIKCSIVETLAPLSLDIVVQNNALETLKTSGIIMLFSFLSLII